MFNKNFRKSLALVLCIGILSLSVPGVVHAKKKPVDFKTFLTKPIALLASILPFINPPGDNKGQEKEDSTYKSNSGSKIKITGNSISKCKPSDED